MAEILDTAIPDVKLIMLVRHEDERGFFMETYSRKILADIGIEIDFVQDNHALSRPAGAVRGLHFQSPPHAQAKLIRVVRGAIFDVAVDIRQGSPTFGQTVGMTLSAAEPSLLYVPAGFAHGYCSLEPDSEIYYKVSAFYAPGHEHGVLWNDPALGIDWPVTPEAAVLSDKDRHQKSLADLPAYFRYTG